MTNPRRNAVVAYVLAGLIIAVDQGAKSWVLDRLGMTPGASMPWLGPIDLTLVRNDGISFGLFQTHADWTRWGLIVFSLGVAIALAVWVWRPGRRLNALALGCLIGGAVGNMIDRIIRGSVVDFIDIRFLHFPWIFNIADAAINVGIALLVAASLLGTPPAVRT